MHNEMTMTKAAKHAKMERKCHNEMKSAAKANNTDMKVHTFCCAQKVMVLHFGSEQPGETQCCSPDTWIC